MITGELLSCYVLLLIGQIPPKAPVVPLTLIAHYWLVQETDSSVILNLTKLNTDSFIHILGLNSVFVKPPKSVWSKWSKCSAMCGYNGRRIRILESVEFKIYNTNTRIKTHALTYHCEFAHFYCYRKDLNGNSKGFFHIQAQSFYTDHFQITRTY